MKLYAAHLDFTAIIDEFRLDPAFPPDVLADAATATDQHAAGRVDATHIPLVTIDPPGSMDLDQAVGITMLDDEHYRVYYAIADPAAFITPGGALHAESLRRGQSIYLPDQTIRLHPPALSENKASLLPNATRPAILWTIDLDPAGAWTDYTITRAIVRSRARFTYEETQAAHDAGTLHPAIAHLPAVGKLLQTSAARRDAITLNFPSQEVQQTPDGLFELIIEPRLPMMDYNSEISLLAGRCAGTTMANAGIGILRTLADPEPTAVSRFWAEAEHLGYTTHPTSPGEFLRTLDANTSRGMAIMREAQKLLRGMAIMREAQKLLRGSEYLELGANPPRSHSGVITNNDGVRPEYYAQVTAPLRRLADRYATEIVLSLVAETPIPDWVTCDLEQVLAAMTASGRLAATVDHACLDYCEAEVLKAFVGNQFPATVVEVNSKQKTARVFVDKPPVLADCDYGGASDLAEPSAEPGVKPGAELVEGERYCVTLSEADPVRRVVRFRF